MPVDFSLSLHLKPSCDASRVSETAGLPALRVSPAESKPSPLVENRQFRLCVQAVPPPVPIHADVFPMHKKTIGPFSWSRRLALAYCGSPADTYGRVNVAFSQVHVLSPCLLDPPRCAPARSVPFLCVFPKASDRYFAARTK